MSSLIVELESLLFDWEAGAVDEAGVQRVREILRSNEEARTSYVQQVINAAMKLDVDAGLEPPHLQEAICAAPTPVVHVNKTASHVFRVSDWAVAAAALLICVLAGRVLYLGFSDDNQPGGIAETNDGQRGEPEEATSSGVALLTRLVDIEWSAQQAPLEVLHEEAIDNNLLVKTTRIGAASIGNWSIPTRPDSEFAIRNLNGSIDEFAILAAALSADEIREMYDNGKP